MQFGLALFILGLLTGFLLPLMANARMGLSSHLEGIMNGLVLVVLGLLWPRLQLGAGSQKVAYYLALYGTYTNVNTHSHTYCHTYYPCNKGYSHKSQ